MSNHHLIVRQVFELEFPAGVDGFALQQEISQIVREKLLPRIETLFDGFAGPEELIRIDRLTLDLGYLPPAELEEALVRQVLRQLEEQLERAVVNRPPGVERLPATQSYFDQWLALLEYGYRPHPAANVPEALLQTAALTQLAAETAAVDRFRRLLQRRPVALLRLVRQHDEPFLVQLLAALTAFSQRTLPDYRREMQQWIAAAQEHTKELAFHDLTLYSPQQFTEAFWLAALESGLEKAATAWTTENLFVAVLHHFAAAAGPQQAWLKLFWQDVVRFQKASYPLLGMVLDRHPQLWKAGGYLSAVEETTFRERQKTGDDRLKMPGSNPKDRTSDAATVGSEPSDRPAAEGDRAREQFPPAVPEARPGATQKPFSATSEEAPQSDGQSEHAGTPTELPQKQVPFVSQTASPDAVRTGDFWYVSNAGIILLHPFLSPFFKSAGLLEQGQFIDVAAQHKAVHLIHFLATGQTQAPEYDLVLPRFLCGLPFDSPLQRFVELTAEERSEGENLLRAAIAHWNRLGSTSPDGLREGFLQRDGKLEKRESGWCLGVEQKTIDILLGFLPWNLSIIKLPWMPELLRVEWA